MNILFIGTWDTVGGAALSAWNMREELRRAGHSVKYLVGFKHSDDINVNELWRNALLNVIGAIFKKDLLATRTFVTANDIDFGASDEIFSHPWYKAADIVECQNLHGNYFKLSALIRMSHEKKVFWALHDEWAIMGHGAWSPSNKPINGFFHRTDKISYPPMLWDNSIYLERKKRQIYNKADVSLIVPSRWLYARVKQSVLSHKPAYIIPYGVDVSLYRPRDKNKSRTMLRLPKNKKIILLISNAGKNNGQKGWWYIDRLKNMMKNSDKVLFLCVGGAYQDKALSDPVVRYEPFTDDHESLAMYYSAADMFLLPSIFENFPLVILESLASGLPVVAYNVGGVHEEVIHKKSGYIAEYKNVDDLASGIRYILRLSRSSYNTMSKFARTQAVEKYSVSEMVQKRLKVYRKYL